MKDKPVKFGIMLCIACGRHKVEPDKTWIMMYGRDSYCICSGQPDLVEDSPSRLYLLGHDMLSEMFSGTGIYWKDFKDEDNSKNKET